ncbi:hypothetical protein Leryth_018656 [Lithospermum erythrorhizon]|nr:hypothetical protein Leryth_018656 [Lithospermum erythrorhizon]
MCMANWPWMQKFQRAMAFRGAWDQRKSIERTTEGPEKYLVARANTMPVAWLCNCQSLRIPFFPDAPTHGQLHKNVSPQSAYIQLHRRSLALVEKGQHAASE